MKKILLPLLFLVSSSLFGQSNQYHSFPDSNAVWNFDFNLLCIGSGQTNDQYSLIITGDTIINNLVYHQLFTPGVISASSGVCGGVSIGYKGAFREDEVNRKVYYLPPLDSTEQLLYDFTMQVGDTVKGFTQQLGLVEMVTSIDSVLVGTSYRKRWNINPCYNIAFIEGVGSTYGLLEASPACITDFPDFSLTCFQEGSSVVYPANVIGCSIITSVSSIKQNQQQSIKISPNPVSSWLTFQTNQLIQEVQVFNLKGQMVYSEQQIFQSRVNLSMLDEGIYMLHVLLENGKSSSVKFVKL